MAALAALAVAVPFSIWLSQSPANLTQAERLGHEIGCTCGTCPLRPIATCGCGFADGMLARLDAEVASGKSDDEIMALFVAEYGPSIKIKPEGSGIGLAAWLVPMALLMVGAVGMSAVISHWRAAARIDAGTHEVDAVGPAEASAPRVGVAGGDVGRAGGGKYRDIVERELDAFDD